MEEGTYYPARDGEGLTVFMMGSIMLEYNRKPLQIPGGPAVCIRENFWTSSPVRNGYQRWECDIRSCISAACGLPAV